MTHTYLELLDARLSETDDVYVPDGVGSTQYFDALRASIRGHLCEPELIVATVTSPGFPDVVEGSVIEGWCVAKQEGYWLVYQPENSRFCCFWGTERKHLTAPGIFGSPLYCWSA